MSDIGLISTVKSLAAEYDSWVNNIREHIHSDPELSFQEYRTSAFVKNKLLELQIPFREIADTGILAWIEGLSDKNKSRVICLRSELDALPIQEISSKDYSSGNEGIMHACGHDVHTASLLGAARILQTCKNDFGGKVYLIFQPGEETLPGGASKIIAEGVIDEIKPDYIIAQHVMPELEAGKVGFRSGMYMASADEIFITIHGKGGHGAMPHLSIDPIVISAQIVSAAQQLVSRWSAPAMPTVLTFGKINSIGGSTNVIPSEVKLEGTFRTYNDDWRFVAHDRLKKLVKGIAESLGAQAEVDIIIGYPALINDEALSKSCQSLSSEYLGTDNVVDLELRPTADDFASYLEKIPGCFYRLGVGNQKKGITHSVHHPQFDIDEEALKIGVGNMAYLTLRLLES